MAEPYVRNGLLPPEIDGYVASHMTPPDQLLVELRAVTRERTDRPSMQIGDDEALLIEILVRASGARDAIEIGTFTGLSAIAIARGLGPSGHLLCCDVSKEWTAIGLEYWKRAGLEDRIELRLGPGLETVQALAVEEQFDFAFVDADKTGYLAYYEELVPRLRRGALLLADNTLQDGRVADGAADDESTTMIRRFNDRVASDERVRSVLLPLSDGVTVVEKR